MDADKALQFVQAARHALRELYLGDKAGNELAAAETRVPAQYSGLSELLWQAEEALIDAPYPWGEQVVRVTDEGGIRLRQLPEFAPMP